MSSKLLAVLTSIILTPFWLVTFTIHAAPENQGQPIPNITVTTAQNPVIEGAATTWHVTVSPLDEVPMMNITLMPQSDNWVWLADVQPIDIVTHTIVIDIPVAPRMQGELLPIFKANFSMEGVEHSLLVVGEMTVSVNPISSNLSTGIITRLGAAQKGEPLPIEVWVNNQTPFTLTVSEIIGSGMDLEWEDSELQSNIPPYSILSQMLSPRVIGRNPQPTVDIIYEWTDAGGQPHTGNLNASGQSIPLAEGVILTNFGSAMIGVFAGAIVSLGVQIILDWHKRKQKRIEEQQQVCGILTQVTSQAQYAAANGSQVDLEILKTIFENGGLYSAAQNYGMVENIHELWSVSENHNNGLKKSGGLERSNQLQNVATNLANMLKQIA